MSATKKLLVATAGFAAAIGAASPAAAQYYPGYNYSYGNGYGYQNSNPGAVVGNLINGVIAATQYGGYQYGNYGYGESYRYGNQTIPANVAVNQCAGAVQARLNGGYAGAYGGYNNYGGGGQIAGITNIEARNNGALRVHGLISTMGGYRGGYDGGYNGYGVPNLSFTCKVDYSGRVIDLEIDRNRGNYRRGW